MGAHPLIRPLAVGPLTLANNLVLAPMAGVTDTTFRLLCRRYGAGFSVSELISAKGIRLASRQTLAMLEFSPQERPFAAQIFGADPETMAVAARAIEEAGLAEVIDLNMGCPVAKVVRGGAGSALLKDLPLAGRVMTAVRAAVRLPVTVKTRLGWDSQHIVIDEFVRRAVDAGMAAITVHARTRAAGYSGTADWTALRDPQHRCGPVPLIANGDLAATEHLERVHEISGCRGFMIGRGAIGRPWLFAALARGEPEPEAASRWRCFARHFVAALAEHDAKGVALFRVHLFAYLKGLPGAASLRRHLSTERDPAAVLRAVAEVFGIAAEHRSDLRGDWLSPPEWAISQESCRHRDVNPAVGATMQEESDRLRRLRDEAIR